MGLTVAVTSNQVVGARRQVVGTVAFDSSYPTGGEALTPATLGLIAVDHINVPAKSGYTFEYDYTNKKLLAYWVDTSVDGAAQAQVVDTTNLSTLTGVRFEAFGN